MDSLAKLQTLMDRAQEELLNSSAQGANPLQVLMAGALPMLRQSLNELVDADGTVDGFLEFTISVLASLRSDGATPLAVAPGGIAGPVLYRGVDPDHPAAAGVLGIGGPVSVPHLPDWAQQLRQVDAGDLAAITNPAPAGDHRPDGQLGD